MFKALKYVIQNYLKKIKTNFFGQFEFEYFGGSDVVNNLDLQKQSYFQTSKDFLPELLIYLA